MNLFAGSLLATGISLLLLVAIFAPLERLFPVKQGQKFLRPHWFHDLGFFLGQYLLWGGAILSALDASRLILSSIVPEEFRAAIVQQPWWLQALEVVLLGDFFLYWGHRLQHRIGFLWRFHAIHHSVEHLDWLAAHREHPIDTIYTQFLLNVPAFVLGFPINTLSALTALRGIWGVFVHSNIRCNLGPFRFLLGSPELHHWHHDRERFAGNYSNLCPLIDVLFGTYRNPGGAPAAYGISEAMPKSFLGKLWFPFRSKRSITPVPEEKPDLPSAGPGIFQRGDDSN